MSSSGSRYAEPLIEVRGVTKAYRVYDKPHHGLLDAILPSFRKRSHEHRALQEIDLEIYPGEAVGILGRNGAGKSTLLEIITGTLQPTQGHVEVRGTVAPLLQLGAGFHPDFTGRENVFLNGLIVGLSRDEVRDRFDDIVAFADIGDFLDQPVKTYSSGMYARLGFAVAISAQPDILIVDEILAVGDLLFQQKCVTRLLQMRQEGLTLIFVSHSPDRVKALCDRGLLLDDGKKIFLGSAEDCADLYLAQNRIEANREKEKIAGKTSEKESRIIQQQTRGVRRYGTQEVKIVDVQVCDEDSTITKTFSLGELIQIIVTYECEEPLDHLNVSYLIRDETGVDLTGTMTWDEGVRLSPMAPGETGKVSFSFVNSLRPGPFGVCVAVTQMDTEDLKRPRLLDQIDGVDGFVVVPNPDRPVHYKFDSRSEVKFLE